MNNTYLKNVAWLLGHRFLKIIINFAVGIYLTSYLGPLDYGLLNYCISVVIILSFLTYLAYEEIIVKYLVSHPQEEGKVLGTAFVLRFIGALVVVTLIGVYGNYIFLDPQQKRIGFIIALSFIFSPFNVIDFYFQSKVQSKYVAIASVVQTFIINIFRIILILIKAKLIFFVYVILLESILTALFLSIFYLRKSLLVRWQFDFIWAKQLLRDSLPLVLAFFAASIMSRVDQLILQDFVGIKAVGVYAFVINMVDVLYQIPIVLAITFFPYFVSIRSVHEEKFHDSSLRFHSMLALSAYVIGFVLYIAASPLVTTFLGQGFLQSVAILKVYSITFVFLFFNAATIKFLLIDRLTGLLLVRTFVGALLNIALNFLFIPYYGVDGAVWAAVITFLFTGYLFDIFSSKTRKMFFIKTQALFLKPFLLK